MRPLLLTIPVHGQCYFSGWTRIIRVVPDPLLLGVTNTLQSSFQPGESIKDISLNDLKANLRQQIRYHCRLSHIAAHTAVWTTTVEEIANDSVDDLIDHIQEFLGLDQDNFMDEIMEEAETGEAAMVPPEDDLRPPEDVYGLYSAMASFGASMMTSVQSMNSADILKTLDEVLLDELRISKNLTAWPCESFWTVGEPNDRLKISPIISRNARAASPNCTAPFTSCFVKRDKCEAKGDGECK
jgi:hypothetical protein